MSETAYYIYPSGQSGIAYFDEFLNTLTRLSLITPATNADAWWKGMEKFDERDQGKRVVADKTRKH